MKKFYWAFIAAFFAVSVQAQYFHHIYGSASGQKLSSGLNTNVLGLGHLVAGHGPAGVIASRTDVNGDITGAPYFNYSYALFNPYTGAQVQVAESKAFEMDNGNGFGIVGKYADFTVSPNTTGVFYLQIDPSGNVVAVFNYVPASPGVFGVMQVGGVAESVISSGNDIYLTGTATSSTQQHAFAMKLDMNTGAVVWSGIYDMAVPSGASHARGNDIVESPYAASGTDEVVMVGQVQDGTNPWDGFFLTLDANNGTPIGNAVIYGTAASIDEFFTITVANATAGGSDGFVLAGGSDANGDADFWMVKTDHTGNTLWATAHDYAGVATGIENVCNDIIERLNTSGNYEYYAGGYVYTGLLGNYDMVIVKTDDMGVSSMGFGQFTYGDSRIDYGIALDQYNGTGADGLSFFGFREGAVAPIINGNYDLYLVKAYFNGETPCNQKIIDAPNASGPKDYTSYSPNLIDKFVQDLDLRQRRVRTIDYTICYKQSLSDGDNSFVAPEKTGDGIMVHPNPLIENTGILNVELENQTAGTVQVAIYDMLGRQYYNGSFTTAKGTVSLPLDITNAGMAAGMYTVRITNGADVKNTLLMVK